MPRNGIAGCKLQLFSVDPCRWRLLDEINKKYRLTFLTDHPTTPSKPHLTGGLGVGGGVASVNLQSYYAMHRRCSKNYAARAFTNYFTENRERTPLEANSLGRDFKIS